MSDPSTPEQINAAETAAMDLLATFLRRSRMHGVRAVQFAGDGDSLAHFAETLIESVYGPGRTELTARLSVLLQQGLFDARALSEPTRRFLNSDGPPPP